MSPQEKLLVVGMQQPGASTAWQMPGSSTNTLPTTFQHGLFVNPRGFTEDTRVQVEKSKWSSPALTGFTAHGQLWGALAQLPSSLAYLPPLPWHGGLK